MTNEQLIKSAHLWTLVILLACGVIAVAASGLRTSTQNSNQNSNRSNSNSSSSRNQNANRNSNSRGAESASQAGMGANSSDQKFAMEAAMGGLMEVELGRLATQQGSSEAVKQFGQRMVDDHSQVNTELMQLASSKGLTLPTALDEKHQKELAKMQKLTGADFDKAYSKAMLSDHEKDVSAFEKESTKGNDADIKAFAAKTLPTLQQHLQLARTLNGQKSNSGSKNSNSNSNMHMNMNMNGNSNKNSNKNSNSNSNSNR